MTSFRTFSSSCHHWRRLLRCASAHREAHPANLLLSMNNGQLLRAFETCRLTPTDFWHPRHLRITYLHLIHHPFEEAHTRFRAGVRRLLHYLGAPDSHYYATITRAQLLAVRYFLCREGARDTSEQSLSVPCAASCLLDHNVMLTHHSPGRLFSLQVRENFLAPNLARSRCIFDGTVDASDHLSCTVLP